MRSIETEISRFRVWCYAPSRNDVLLNRRTLSLGLQVFFYPEGGFEIVEQLNLDAVPAHDEALLQHRERVVPGPVDHEAGGEAREHEGEDDRHPAEDELLGRIRGR